MLQRVADRYQLQRDKKRAGRQGINPLVWPAIVAALALARDAYTFVTSHQLRWTAIVSAPLLVAFLILYLCKSRLAWWLILI